MILEQFTIHEHVPSSRRNLLNLNIWKLYKIVHVQSIKINTNKIDPIKIFIKYISNKKLASRKHKELSKTNNSHWEIGKR